MKTQKNLLENTQKFRKTRKGVLTNLYQKMKQRNIAKGFGTLQFSLKDIQNIFLNDEKYQTLFNEWVVSGYTYYKKPSIDRKNPDYGYSLDNIQIMSWEDNRRKGDLENSKRITTAIIMCDFEGNIIKEFNSVKQAVNETGLSQGNIVMCCQGKRRHTGGYVFKYRGDKFRKHKSYLEYSVIFTKIQSYWRDKK